MKDYLPLLGLLPLVLLPILWYAIVQLLSWLSGWRTLAAAYATTTVPAAGALSRMQSGRIGVVSYRNSLNVGVTPQGLYLSVLLPFRPGHAPLLIPWHGFHHREDRSLLWYKGVRFEVGPSNVRVELPARILEAAPLP
jgi:hypothetical protein